MTRIQTFLFIALGIITTTHAQQPPLPIKQVVIWGHKLHSHTHSYIHYAFHKTFTHLGYKTYWMDKPRELRKIHLPGTLFITEGQVDNEIPIRHDCWYVLHNCYNQKYKPLIAKNRVLTLQVYTHSCRQQPLEQLAPYILFSLEGKTLYMPWATDLLPHEIDEMKRTLVPFSQREPQAVWIGTVGAGLFGNIHELTPFVKGCHTHNIPWRKREVISADKNHHMVHNALLAPAIVGTWQLEHGYIPCRIFKNISYGALGATNSETVYDLFQGKILYNQNTEQLCYDMLQYLNTHDVTALYPCMDFVRDHHTYINRINHILTCLARIANTPA